MAVVVDRVVVVVAVVRHFGYVDVMDGKMQVESGKTRLELGRVGVSSHFPLGPAAVGRFLEPPPILPLSNL